MGVNERLEQLRREQAPRPSPQQFEEMSSIAISRSIPGELRQILQLPETVPPLPRGPRRQAGTRRIPGPPPPPSWLHHSQHAPADVRKNAREWQRLLREKSMQRQRPVKFNRLTLLDVGSQSLPRDGSLANLALKSMALNWNFIRDYELHNIPALPVQLKSCLIAYLTLHGPDDSLDLATLRWLFSEEDCPGTVTASDQLVRLDLTSLLWRGFTVRDVARYLSSPPSLGLSVEESSAERRVKGNTSGSRRTTNTCQKDFVSVTESTDDQENDGGEDWTNWEEMAKTNRTLHILKNPVAASFPNLTHLSLANAGSCASWPQLLDLSTHLATITHLSLASWPTPTNTPNSMISFIHDRHQDIAVGGSHFYSAMDHDWYGASSILRRLSQKLYCLKWLDLEGCNEWLSALVWKEADSTRHRWTNRQRAAQVQESVDATAVLEPSDALWSSSRGQDNASQGPDWNGSWAQISYINVSQGALPNDVEAVRRLPAGVIACELLSYLRDRDEEASENGDDVDVLRWLEREKEARSVRSAVRLIRARARGLYCEFDHGWEGNVFLPSRSKETDHTV
jgi:hypothetical protein